MKPDCIVGCISIDGICRVIVFINSGLHSGLGQSHVFIWKYHWVWGKLSIHLYFKKVHVIIYFWDTYFHLITNYPLWRINTYETSYCILVILVVVGIHGNTWLIHIKLVSFETFLAAINPVIDNDSLNRVKIPQIYLPPIVYCTFIVKHGCFLRLVSIDSLGRIFGIIGSIIGGLRC